MNRKESENTLIWCCYYELHIRTEMEYFHSKTNVNSELNMMDLKEINSIAKNVTYTYLVDTEKINSKNLSKLIIESLGEYKKMVYEKELFDELIFKAVKMASKDLMLFKTNPNAAVDKLLNRYSEFKMFVPEYLKKSS